MNKISGVRAWAVFVLVSAVAAQGANLALEVAFEENGLPLQLRNVTSTSDVAFDSVDIKNLSQHTVRSIKFAVVVYDVKSSSATPATVLTGKTVLTNIEPGADVTVHVKFMAFTDMDSRLSKLGTTSGIGDFGVVRIDFDDGSSWYFDTEGRGGFRAKPETSEVRATEAKVCGPNKKPRLVATAEAADVVTPFGYFKCLDTGSCIL